MAIGYRLQYVFQLSMKVPLMGARLANPLIAACA
jgi:hypothetical protein